MTGPTKGGQATGFDELTRVIDAEMFDSFQGSFHAEVAAQQGREPLPSKTRPQPY